MPFSWLSLPSLSCPYSVTQVLTFYFAFTQQINMAESRKSWLQLLSVILVVLLLLEAAESRVSNKDMIDL